MVKKRLKIPKGYLYSRKEIWEGDLVWLTIGAKSSICIVLKVNSQTSFIVFSEGQIVKVNNWRLEKIE
tara:strand:- start:997 stop:1200 length:204 start_codon:yes stop_codon:yes gene_type:complete